MKENESFTLVIYWEGTFASDGKESGPFASRELAERAMIAAFENGAKKVTLHPRAEKDDNE